MIFVRQNVNYDARATKSIIIFSFILIKDLNVSNGVYNQDLARLVFLSF
jgi:hypothetical protein